MAEVKMNFLFFSVLSEGSTLTECGLSDGCKLTLIPNVETGLVVSFIKYY